MGGGLSCSREDDDEWVVVYLSRWGYRLGDGFDLLLFVSLSLGVVGRWSLSLSLSLSLVTVRVIGWYSLMYKGSKGREKERDRQHQNNHTIHNEREDPPTTHLSLGLVSWWSLSLCLSLFLSLR